MISMPRFLLSSTPMWHLSNDEEDRFKCFSDEVPFGRKDLAALHQLKSP